MCGIVGIWDRKNKINPNLLIKMRDTLAHRGPDDAGIFVDDENNVGLAHRRLSILDLSKAGRQPMGTGGKLTIAYNGEIYNFREIRKELKSIGYDLVSDSDTEVVLKAYKQWGINAVDKFRGMFVFGIWDQGRKKMILCRDRVGVKPLYYYFDGNLLVFASELRAVIFHPSIKKEINKEALAIFLQLGYIPAPYSIFKNIYKLEPGCFLEIDNNRKLKIKKYWDITKIYLKGEKTYSEHSAEEELEKRLLESFKLRMVSDVPVGVLLSGGIDSSMVAALLQKNSRQSLTTFTVGFNEKKYNEAEYAKKIAKHLKTEHYELYCTPKEAMEIIPNMPEYYDEPFGDSSAIPSYLVAKFASQKVKVVLSADGGDELFCGYDRYRRMDKIYKNIDSIPDIVFKAGKLFDTSVFRGFVEKIAGWSNLSHKLKKIEKLSLIKSNPSQAYSILNSYWFKEETKELILGSFDEDYFSDVFFREFKKVESLGLMSQMQVIDLKYYLPDDILVKVDRSTMANSIEGRDPFLDQEIIEFAASLPLELKYRKGESKYILKKILFKHIPKELVDRPKQGLRIPIDPWLKKELKPLLQNYIDPGNIAKEGILDHKIIEKELDDFLNNRIYGNRLWNVLVFQMWKERWFDQ